MASEQRKVVAPEQCQACREHAFEQIAYGLWDGRGASGVFHKVRCQGCGAVWRGALTHEQADEGHEPEWFPCDW
jgi:hypothetical protein